MVLTINIPNIGEEILEVTEILVKVGDNINVNQPLLVIEGDKTSMEIPAPKSGIITKIHTNIGDKVHTGSIILSIDPKNEIKETSTHHTTTKFNLLKQNKLECNTEKYNKQYYDKYNTNFITHATPFIRQMARNFEIDLSKIKGSGRKGRILKEDIQNYLLNESPQDTENNNKTITSQTSYFSDTTQTQYTEKNFKKFGDIEVISLSKIQKYSGMHLQKNWATIPHITQFDTADITDLEKFRKQQNLEIKNKNIHHKITLLTFIIKSVAKALEIFPRFNSSLSQNGHTLILKKYINIGIAVNTEKGLLVPVLKDVNKKGIMQLSQELSEISKKARSNHQLHPLDIQGGSFTISNLGGIGGGKAFTPIINSTEVAILGISKSSVQPTWTGKKFIPRLILPLSLSYDHRVIDGVDGAKFMNLINQIISDIRFLSM